MGKISTDAITHGFRGSFGEDLAFRRIGNKTFFMRKGKSTTPATAQQQQTRTRFAEASNYATTAMEDAQTHMAYTVLATANGLRSAYVAAIKDFMTEPEIENITTRTYTGAAGNPIMITPRFAYKITRLEVTIKNADGTVLESGPATPLKERWQYKAMVVNPQVAGCRLVLKAFDRLGKEFVVERGL
jgi:hypothetical protein